VVAVLGTSGFEDLTEQVLSHQAIRLAVTGLTPLIERPAIVEHAMTDETEHRKLAVGKFMQAVRIGHLQSDLHTLADCPARA